MTEITIIGKGNMGTAINEVFGTGNHSVQILDSDDGDQSVSGEIVVLAVPYAAIDDVVGAHGDDLAGKTVVDITNPLDFETFDSLVVPADGSAAQEIARKLPQSQVLKAFNTNFAGTLSSGTVGGSVPTTVLVAGDDDGAKRAFIAAVEAGGMRVKDAGALKRARELEAFGFLQMTLAASEKVRWNSGFGVID